MKTPILFLIYNRPNLEKQVFEKIRQAKPSDLYVASDGPKDRSDKKLCDEAKKIITTIDWPCHLHTLYRKKNLGCGKAVSGAIDWFFSHIEEGIILEDDCLPDLSFFPYCEDLLTRYRNDPNIMLISGTTYFLNPFFSKSYSFSIFPQIWGWASWRRAWKLYDYSMKAFPRYLYSNKISEIIKGSREQTFWNKLLTRAHKHEIDSWDLQWAFTCFLHKGLCIIPKTNLVSNIGFYKQALHTKGKPLMYVNKTMKIHFPLEHPEKIHSSVLIDSYIQKNIYNPSPIMYILQIPFLEKINRLIHYW
jgi:hypothetical protein